MKPGTQLRLTTLVLVVGLMLSGLGCGKKAQPPLTGSPGAGEASHAPDSSSAAGDTSHATAVRMSPASPTHAAASAKEHPATGAPSKTAVVSPSAPAREPAAAPASTPSPAPAPVPASTPAAPPAQTAEAAGGLDAGPRAAEIPVDQALASKGKSLFIQKSCNTCHQIATRLVGPPLGPVPRQRSGAWIMAMIQRPAEMTKSDPIAKQLLQEYKIQMVLPRGVSADEARALLEYLKSVGK